MPLDGSLTDVPALAGFLSFIAQAVRLDPDQHSFLTRDINGRTVATHTYDASTAGAGNQFMAAVIEGAGHQYTNGTNHPVVMADFLWAFFSRHTLP